MAAATCTKLLILVSMDRSLISSIPIEYTQ